MLMKQDNHLYDGQEKEVFDFALDQQNNELGGSFFSSSIPTIDETRQKYGLAPVYSKAEQGAEASQDVVVGRAKARAAASAPAAEKEATAPQLSRMEEDLEVFDTELTGETGEGLHDAAAMVMSMQAPMLRPRSTSKLWSPAKPDSAKAVPGNLKARAPVSVCGSSHNGANAAEADGDNASVASVSMSELGKQTKGLSASDHIKNLDCVEHMRFGRLKLAKHFADEYLGKKKEPLSKEDADLKAHSKNFESCARLFPKTQEMLTDRELDDHITVGQAVVRPLPYEVSLPITVRKRQLDWKPLPSGSDVISRALDGSFPYLCPPTAAAADFDGLNPVNSHIRCGIEERFEVFRKTCWAFGVCEPLKSGNVSKPYLATIVAQLKTRIVSVSTHSKLDASEASYMSALSDLVSAICVLVRPETVFEADGVDRLKEVSLLSQVADKCLIVKDTAQAVAESREFREIVVECAKMENCLLENAEAMVDASDMIEALNVDAAAPQDSNANVLEMVIKASGRVVAGLGFFFSELYKNMSDAQIICIAELVQGPPPIRMLSELYTIFRNF